MRNNCFDVNTCFIQVAENTPASKRHRRWWVSSLMILQDT